VQAQRVRGVTRLMRSIPRVRQVSHIHVGLMKAGACERSEVRAGIIKVREEFFDAKFHDVAQDCESPSPLTQHSNTTWYRCVTITTMSYESQKKIVEEQAERPELFKKKKK
jgi:hypothetical protein